MILIDYNGYDIDLHCNCDEGYRWEDMGGHPKFQFTISHIPGDLCKDCGFYMWHEPYRKEASDDNRK